MECNCLVENCNTPAYRLGAELIDVLKIWASLLPCMSSEPSVEYPDNKTMPYRILESAFRYSKSFKTQVLIQHFFKKIIKYNMVLSQWLFIEVS